MFSSEALYCYRKWLDGQRGCVLEFVKRDCGDPVFLCTAPCQYHSLEMAPDAHKDIQLG